MTSSAQARVPITVYLLFLGGRGGRVWTLKKAVPVGGADSIAVAKGRCPSGRHFGGGGFCVVVAVGHRDLLLRWCPAWRAGLAAAWLGRTVLCVLVAPLPWGVLIVALWFLGLWRRQSQVRRAVVPVVLVLLMAISVKLPMSTATLSQCSRALRAVGSQS